MGGLSVPPHVGGERNIDSDEAVGLSRGEKARVERKQCRGVLCPAVRIMKEKHWGGTQSLQSFETAVGGEIGISASSSVDFSLYGCWTSKWVQNGEAGEKPLLFDSEWLTPKPDTYFLCFRQLKKKICSIVAVLEIAEHDITSSVLGQLSREIRQILRQKQEKYVPDMQDALPAQVLKPC